MADAAKRPLSRLDLESLISDAGTAGAVIEVIADMLNSCRRDGTNTLGNYTTFYLTEAQDRALFAATTQAAYATRQLEEAFYGSRGAIE